MENDKLSLIFALTNLFVIFGTAVFSALDRRRVLLERTSEPITLNLTIEIDPFAPNGPSAKVSTAAEPKIKL
jgi:hypothetical protein